MEVREEDLAELRQADVGAQQLALRSLGTVDQEPVATATDECGCRGPLRRRSRARGPEEDDVEVHGGRMLPPGRFLPHDTGIKSPARTPDMDLDACHVWPP